MLSQNYELNHVLISARTLMASLFLQSGARYSWKDCLLYYRSAVQLVEKGDLSYSSYQVRDGEVRNVPLTHFPPLTSVAIALPISLGIPPHHAPSMVNLLSWISLLLGSVLLTRELTTQPYAPAYTVVWISITSPIVGVYGTLLSEPLFLAILILFIWQLTKRGRSNDAPLSSLLGVAALGGLLALSRYVGIFFVLGSLVWWAGIHWGRRPVRTLVAESAVLSLGILPVFLWVLRNLARTGHAFGDYHLEESAFSFTQGLIGLIKNSAWIVFPLLRPGPILRELGPVMFFVAAVLGLAMLAGSLGASGRANRLLRDNPIGIFVLIYLAVFAFLQPILSFYPMTSRFMSVALVMLIPWVVAALSRLPVSLYRSLSVSFLLGNLFLFFLLIHRVGAGELLRAGVPVLHDLGGNHEKTVHLLYQGIPNWLLHYPARIGDLETHLPDLDEYLKKKPLRMPIISNAPDLFPDHPVLRAKHPVDIWVEQGTCTPAATVILLDWDRWTGKGPGLPYWNLDQPRELLEEIEAKCGPVNTVNFSKASVVLLPRSNLAAGGSPSPGYSPSLAGALAGRALMRRDPPGQREGADKVLDRHHQVPSGQRSSS